MNDFEGKPFFHFILKTNYRYLETVCFDFRENTAYYFPKTRMTTSIKAKL